MDRLRNRVGKLAILRRHGVERAVRFDVRQPAAERLRERGNCADLIDHHVVRFARTDGHRSASEALQIRQPWMRADGHAFGERHLDGLMNRRRIASVETAGDIGGIHIVQYGEVVAHRVGAEALAHVAIEIDACHQASSAR